MTTLTEAQTALDAAQANYGTAVGAAHATRSAADNLRQRVASGRGADVLPDQIAAADQAADHAALVVQGAVNAMAGLEDGVQTAQADALCDEIIATLPTLGTTVSASLDAVADAISTYVTSVLDFNAYTTGAVTRLDHLGAASSRARRPRHGFPTVDHVDVAPLHGDRHLVAATLAPLRALGAPAYYLTEAKTVARAASTIPTA
jgi:hypothetical protein